MSRNPTRNERFGRAFRRLLLAVERAVAVNRELEQAHVALSRAVTAPELRLVSADPAPLTEEGGRNAS